MKGYLLERQVFLTADDATIADVVRSKGLKVVTFPINGTRRWYLLEHAPTSDVTDPMQHYMEVAGQQHIALYEMFFKYGEHTLLTPIFGPDLMDRGAGYVQMAVAGMRYFVEDATFLDFYERYDVRVRFYGEHRKFFAGTPFAELSDLFDQIATATQHHTRHRLLIGVCANDNVRPVAEMAVDYYKQHGTVPDRDDLVVMYYGEPVPSVDLFIGFDKFAAFDMPLLTTGEEDLYFTVAPSLYLSDAQLREILYDHLFTRQMHETDYQDLTPDDWQTMRAFYHVNRHNTLGVGKRQAHGNYWYPLPQVTLPPEF